MNKRAAKAIRFKAKQNTQWGNEEDEQKEYERLKQLYKSVKQNKSLTTQKSEKQIIVNLAEEFCKEHNPQ